MKWMFIALLVTGCCGSFDGVRCETDDSQDAGNWPKATCAEACTHLRDLGCAEADAATWDPDAGVPSCEDQCDVSLIPGCVVSTDTCSDMNRCVNPDK